MISIHPWTPEELEKLREIYPRTTRREVARILGRSEGSVQGKVKYLGLRRVRNYKPWTETNIAEFRLLYPVNFSAEIAKRLGRSIISINAMAGKLGLSKDPEWLKANCGFKPGAKVGASYRFPKGHRPANKGLRRPGYAVGRMAQTQFKKGQRPRNYYPVGSIVPNADGYLRIKVKEKADGHGGLDKAWEFLHRRVWEKAHGPIPKGHRIWWKDGDHNNCALENLELLTDAEHMGRTTIHKLPKELVQVIQLTGALTRKIRRKENAQKQDQRPAQPPVRNAGSAQR
jgi:hypothetical protein